MQNPFELTDKANEEVAELIKARQWEKINEDLEALGYADGNLLVDHESKRVSLLDLAVLLDAPEEVTRVLILSGFNTTELVKRIGSRGPEIAARK